MEIGLEVLSPLGYSVVDLHHLNWESVFLMVIQTVWSVKYRSKTHFIFMSWQGKRHVKMPGNHSGQLQNYPKKLGRWNESKREREDRGLSNKYCCLLQLKENGITLVIPLDFLDSLCWVETRLPLSTTFKLFFTSSLFLFSH